MIVRYESIKWLTRINTKTRKYPSNYQFKNCYMSNYVSEVMKIPSMYLIMFLSNKILWYKTICDLFVITFIIHCCYYYKINILLLKRLKAISRI